MDPHGIGVRLRRAESALLTALFFGLLAGFAEVLLLAFQRYVLGHFIWTPGPFGWTTPLGYLIVFAPTGGILALFALAWPRGVSSSVTAFVLAGLGIFGLLSMMRRLHPFALVLLAAGMAAVTARTVAGHPIVWRRVRTRGTILLSTLWLGIFGATRVWPTGIDLAHRGPAPPGAPNVLLIVWDTVRARSLSLYGYERETTPFLERLQAQSIVFDLAVSTAPWTLPSHASLFTGRDAHELRASWLVPLEAGPPTLAETFRNHGYRTAGFTANWAYTDREKGLARGFDTYVDHQVTARQAMLSSAVGQVILRWGDALLQAADPGDFVRRIEYVHPFPGRMAHRRVAEDIDREFHDWVTKPSSRPFFVFLNFIDAHEPYHAPTEQRRRFHSDNQLRDAYDAAIAHLDETLEQLLARLHADGQLQHTIVAITSDHGELLGEHGLLGHGNSLYFPLLHVPLLILGPGVTPVGRRVVAPTSLRDLPVTLLELAGIGTSELPGRSLQATWKSTTLPREFTLAEVRKGLRTPPRLPVTQGDMWSLTTSRFHYIVDGTGTAWLYDHQNDQFELYDLGREELPDSLATQLASEIDAAKRARASSLFAAPGSPR